MPEWAFHKNLLNYQILAVESEGDTTFEKYKKDYYYIPEIPAILENFFFLFLFVPVLILNIYLKSVGYTIAGGRGVSVEWIHYFFNFYLKSEFIFSVYTHMSNVTLNVSGHRRTRSNYTGSWTPFRGRFRWGFFLRKRYIQYTYAWGDIVLNFRKRYTYSRLYFYKHLIFFNYCSYIFVFYASYIIIIIIIFLIFFNFLKTENYIDNDSPGRNYRELNLTHEIALTRFGIYIKVVRKNLRKFLINKL